MRQITLSHLRELAAVQQGPCISLYQPTHRQFPDSRENLTRYRNLLRELESTLASKYRSADYRSLVDKFQALATDSVFWNHRTEALAVLGSPQHFEVYDLLQSTKELLVVADSFHLKPLFKMLQGADRFQILALSRNKVSLYEGNRYALEEEELDERVPRTLDEALGRELTEPYVAATAGGAAVHGLPGGAGIFYGTGQKRDEVHIDTERFFKIVDRAILDYHSRPSGLPLLLAALPEHHAHFRRSSQNPFLMEEGLMFDPDSVNNEQLLAEAWKKLEPKYIERLEELVDQFHLAASRGLATEDIDQIASAAAAGRIDTLLVEADREIRGRIVGPEGDVVAADDGEAGYDDLLDDLAERTFRTDGEVVVLPRERMPTGSGAAAILRY